MPATMGVRAARATSFDGAFKSADHPGSDEGGDQVDGQPGPGDFTESKPRRRMPSSSRRPAWASSSLSDSWRMKSTTAFTVARPTSRSSDPPPVR